MTEVTKLNIKSSIVIVLILLGLSWIGAKNYHLNIAIRSVHFENQLHRDELDSIHKRLAYREKIVRIWADRYDFLRYQL
jgi:hypothetical protein